MFNLCFYFDNNGFTSALLSLQRAVIPSCVSIR